MCGRFQASRSAAEVARWFKTTGRLPNSRERYNAAPTQSLLTVLGDRESGERRLDTLRWGLIPFWAKDATIGYKTINAMCETVASKPAFREAFKSRRCLVPADAFYEWKKLDPNETAIPLRNGGRVALRLRRAVGAMDRTGERRDGQELYRHHLPA
jgi:putative SOS response-associated peptidase YedK